jgi:hypothetical protein
MQIKRVTVDPGLEFCEGCHIFGNETLIRLTTYGPVEKVVHLCDACCEMLHFRSVEAQIGEL